MNEVDYTTKFEQIIKSMAYNDVKSVQIRSYFWSLFSCIRTEYGDLRVQIRSYFWSVFSRIRNEYGEKNVQIRSYFWSVFSLFRTEYGEILRISPYSVRMRENTDQKKLHIWTLFTQWWGFIKKCMFEDNLKRYSKLFLSIY